MDEQKINTSTIGIYIAKFISLLLLVIEFPFKPSRCVIIDKGQDRKVVSMAIIGDSLTTGFYVSALPSMIWRARSRYLNNWFINTDNDFPSVCDYVSESTNLEVHQFATPSAKVSNTAENTIGSILIGSDNLYQQVTKLLKLQKLPDITVLWIGHNNIDWIEEGNKYNIDNSHEILDIIVQKYLDAFNHQLQRIIKTAIKTNKKSVVIVFGLINFESFFTARIEAENLRSLDDRLFPYLTDCYQYFESMKPEYRDNMIVLANRINFETSLLITSMNNKLNNNNICLNYSDDLYNADISSSLSISEIDAWHPSSYGHHVFADACVETIKNIIKKEFFDEQNTTN